MKQKMVKRAMAVLLSAALALPGIPVETHAAGTENGRESALDLVNFSITNPNREVNAYIGQPLVFYVRANGDDDRFTHCHIESDRRQRRGCG